MKFISIIQLTFRESLAKKTFIAFFGLSSLVILLFMFALNLDIVNGMTSSISIFGKDMEAGIDIRKIIWAIEGGVAILLFTGGLFMSLFATSSLVPTLLQPGFIDLFVSKPVSRLQILAGRYLGAVAIVAFNVFYLVFAAWLVMSIKTGFWNWGFLLSGIMILVTFSVLFSLMTLLGILTKSGPFSLMLTYFILFFSPLLLERDKIYALLSSRVYGLLVDGIYYVMPKTAELGNMTQQLARGVTVSSWTPLWSSLLFGGCVFIFSALIFQRKNF